MTVASASLEQFHHHGFVSVTGLLSPEEATELQNEADRLFRRTDLIDSDNIRCRWQNHFETGECRFDCFDPVIDLSSTFERLAHSPRIVDVISGLYGERACLFKDKLIFKPPKAAGYGLHQDYISWESFPESFVTDCRDRPVGCVERRHGSVSGVSQARMHVAKGRHVP